MDYIVTDIHPVPEKPVFDYPNMPYLPREGIKYVANCQWATRSLFLETAPKHLQGTTLWCLSEGEQYANGRWYPSAWMTYIHATDDYDACRKICGNIRQWRYVCALIDKLYPDMLSDWKAEQTSLQKSVLREILKHGAAGMGAGYTSAAKLVLDMIDKDGYTKKVGRPKKIKPELDSGVGEDLSRIAQFK